MKKKNQKTKGTEMIIILDRSGSMGMVKKDTIGGFNQFLNDQKKIKDNTKMTMVLFDHEYEFLYKGIKLQEVNELNKETFVPRGMTALYDAIGRTIAETEIKLKNKNKNVIFVIITDGFENASHEFNTSQIKKMIEEKIESGWNFVYLGANQDAITSAQKIGVNKKFSATYKSDSIGTTTLYNTISSKMSSYRSSGNFDNFSDKERDNLINSDKKS